jgi:hypothetical protein
MTRGSGSAAPAPKAGTRARKEWRVVPSGRLDGCHDVIDPEGVIYGTYASAAQARATCSTRQREADHRARVVTRPCMCCRAPFDSEGPHNRLCPLCRRRGSEPMEPQRPYIDARGRG